MIQIWIIIDIIIIFRENDPYMDQISITNIKVLGQAIYQARKAHNLTQEELAARTGVSRRLIYQLENGSRDSFPLGKVLHILKRMNLELSISTRTLEK